MADLSSAAVVRPAPLAASQQLLAPRGPVWWVLGSEQAGQVQGVALGGLELLVTGGSVCPGPRPSG